MLDNLRWILCFLGLGLALAGMVALVYARAGHKSLPLKQGALAIYLGVLVAWVFAQIPPFGPWGFNVRSVRRVVDVVPQPRLLLACFAYLGIVAASSRGLIGMPQYRLIQSRAADLQGLTRVAGRGIVNADERQAAELSWKDRIDRAKEKGAYRVLGGVVSVPLPSVARAARTLNSIERQILSALDGHDLRLQACAIAASLPSADPQGRALSEAIRIAVANRRTLDENSLSRGQQHPLEGDQTIRAACVDALALQSKLRDEPQELEAGRIRVAMWLTLVGLAAIYVVGSAFSGLTDALIAGALGGMLGSLSVLILRQTMSLGLIVLAPVAGALNATGGLVLIDFLAQDKIQVLGEVFRETWAKPNSPSSLAVAVLLGFSGGLFARIAVAGAAPLLGGSTGESGRQPTSVESSVSHHQSPRPRPSELSEHASTAGHASSNGDLPPPWVGVDLRLRKRDRGNHT